LRIATVARHHLVRILADSPWGKVFEQLWEQKTGSKLKHTMKPQDNNMKGLSDSLSKVVLQKLDAAADAIHLICDE
jgi:hypothetical protein